MTLLHVQTKSQVECPTIALLWSSLLSRWGHVRAVHFFCYNVRQDEELPSPCSPVENDHIPSAPPSSCILLRALKYIEHGFGAQWNTTWSTLANLKGIIPCRVLNILLYLQHTQSPICTISQIQIAPLIWCKPKIRIFWSILGVCRLPCIKEQRLSNSLKNHVHNEGNYLVDLVRRACDCLTLRPTQKDEDGVHEAHVGPQRSPCANGNRCTIYGMGLHVSCKTKKRERR